MQNPIGKDILTTAASCINGERAGDYGKAIDNFERIAALWTAMTKPTPDGYQPVYTVEDVANFMMCVKLARLVNTPGHADSLVDICGYAALGRQTHVDVEDREQAQLDADAAAFLGEDGFPDEDFDRDMENIFADDEEAQASFSTVRKPTPFLNVDLADMEKTIIANVMAAVEGLDLDADGPVNIFVVNTGSETQG